MVASADVLGGIDDTHDFGIHKIWWIGLQINAFDTGSSVPWEGDGTGPPPTNTGIFLGFRFVSGDYAGAGDVWWVVGFSDSPVTDTGTANVSGDLVVPFDGNEHTFEIRTNATCDDTATEIRYYIDNVLVATLSRSTGAFPADGATVTGVTYGGFTVVSETFTDLGCECCPVADPPEGPFDDFTELDQFTFFPGQPLRASTLEVLNKNILEATLSPEIFPPVVYHNGDIVPLPISPVDGYHYSREELTYLWNWNNTGPESEIRLPIFSGFVFNSAGAFSSVPGFVHTQVFRLPAGHPPEATTDGSLRVIVIGSRQAQHPAILDDGANDPGGGVSGTDLIQGSITLTAQGAAIPPTVLFTPPTGRGGQYQISYTAKVTQVATTSSSLGGANGFQVSYADMNDLQELLTPPTPVNAGNALSTQISGVIVANPAENTDVTFQLDYASVGTTPMQFSLEVNWKEL